MLSISWPRWVTTHFEKKTFRRRQIRRPHMPLALEELEKRELLVAEPLAGLGVSGYTPSQISHAYGFDQIRFANGTVKGDGSGQTIALVAAYNDPNIANDLQIFSQQFGLPNASLSVLNQMGGTYLPPADPTGEWEAEEALDVEWAHAMAPGANLVLVEANSDNISDLLSAVRTAAALPGVSVVSISWGDAEFATEADYDSYFTTPVGHSGVTFVAASGDNGAPPLYPAASPNVLAVGGTTLTLDSQGNYVGETAWSGSGGGISAYEAQPSYQKGTVSQSTTQRTNPDVAYDADPQTGFAVYDSYGISGGWIDKGGTSGGAPQWAALIAIADQGRALAGKGALDGASQTLPLIYQMPNSNFHDIVAGASMGDPSYSAGAGYDLVTGRGTPYANRVVNYLVDGSSPGLPTSPPPSPSPGPSPSPSPGGNLINDGDFEYPSVGANPIIQPSGSPWTFIGWAGIAGNNSSLTSGNTSAANGLQSAFLYLDASILQSVNLAAGSYTLRFQAAQVGSYPGSQEQIEVLVNSAVVALVKPGLAFTTYTTTFTVPSAGFYTIQFLGIAPSGTNAALLDNVFLQSDASDPVTPLPSPSPSPSPSSSPTTNPSPAPPSDPPSSSAPSEDQPPSAASPSLQDAVDTLLQSVLAALNNFLQSEWRFLEMEWNQIMMLVEQWEAQNQPLS
jgi:hypothetical protein